MWESWWTRMPQLRQHTICLVFLLLVALGFFAPALFSGKSVIGGDAVRGRSMAQAMVDYREATGEEPLWSPNAFGGMPGYIISFPRKIPQFDSVPTWFRTFAWPVSHFIFLLAGTYFLVFLLTRDTWSSVLAASAYGLTTYLPVLLIAGHNTKFITLCFAPWLVLAFLFVLRKPGLMAGLLFAMAASINLRANHIQITYYITILCGIWWVVEGISAWRKGEAKTFFGATGWLVLGSAVALLMVAQPYLSTFEYKEYSIRGAASGGGTGGLAWEYAMGWSQGIGEILTLLIADAYGGGGGLGSTYWGPKIFTEGPHYVGGIALMLAALALWQVRNKAVLALGISAFLMTLFSFGENLAFLNRLMFNYFPLFSSFRVPETWLSVVAFQLAVLAGVGLYYATRPGETKDETESTTKATLVVAGVSLGLVALLLVGKGFFFDFEKPGEFQQIQQALAAQYQRQANDPEVLRAADQYVETELIGPRKEKFQNDALRTLLFLLLAGAALLAYRKGKMPAWAMQVAIVLLVIMDLGSVGRRHFNEQRLQPTSNIENLIQTYAFDEFIMQQEEAAGGPGTFRVLSLETGDPTKNARPSSHYESIGGYSAAKLRVIQDYYDHLFADRQTALPNDNALDLLSVKYVIARSTFPGMSIAYEDPNGMYVLENEDALPRAFLAGETEVIGEVEALWERLKSSDYDPRRTVLLSEPADFTPTPIDSASTTEVSLESFSPREIRWSVETDAPRWLVASEIYYPAGWNAYINGDPAPIHQADYLLRAVPIPEGTHEVVMRFEPTSYRASIWISGVSTALVYGALLAFLGMAWMRRQKTPEQTDAPA